MGTTLLIILSGVAGTFAMTCFVELLAAISKKPFHVVRILSRMLQYGDNTPKHKRQITYGVAIIIHYLVGISFTNIFVFLLKTELIEPEIWYALIFGAVAGLVGILGWRIFFAIHPNPAHIDLSQYLIVIWAGHLIFALAMFLLYIELQPGRSTVTITVC
jgi:hypothetical protein